MNKEKECIHNNCHMCHHSAKNYLCIRDIFSVQDAAFCMYIDMTEGERQARFSNNVECEHFELAKLAKVEMLVNIDESIKEMTAQLKYLAKLLNTMKEDEERSGKN